MKKFISLALALVMTCTLGTTAFAAEITNDTEQQSAQSEIVYNLDTSYSIYIPEQIDMSNGSYTFEANYVNLSETEQVVVRMSGVDEVSRLTLQSQSGDELKCEVTYSGCAIAPNFIIATFTDSATSNGTFELRPSTSYKANRTGQYSGIFEFTISVEDRK